MLIDETPSADNQPWELARTIIADQGFNAECYVIRLATTLADEGNVNDASKLGAVLDAISVLRQRQGIGSPSSQH